MHRHNCTTGVEKVFIRNSSVHAKKIINNKMDENINRKFNSQRDYILENESF